MRYRFRGLIRSNGKPVEGHVEADTPDDAINALSENGIVTESLREEPKSLDLSQAPATNPSLATAIESALDISSTQVSFDALTQKFKGKSVWVIDREKIRRRVAEAVDAAMAQSAANADTDAEARARVSEAINNLFKDNRNLTSQVSSTSANLERQINRLGQFISKAESVLASIIVAVRNGGFGGGGGPRRHAMQSPQSGQNEVLLEIFKMNLELRGITVDEGPPSEQAAGQTAAEENGTANGEAAQVAAVESPPPADAATLEPQPQ